MAEGHNRDAWGRMSALLALTANCHRDPKKGRVFKPADFDPTTRPETDRQVIRVTKDNIGLMKQAFTTGKGVQS